MSKPKRNDPCPCGSGKKFKKCCGFDNVIAFNPSLYIQEFDQLQGDLIHFSCTTFEEELLERTSEYIQLYVDGMNDDTLKLYVDLLTTWTMLRDPIKDGKTLFELFYAQKHQSIKSPTVKKAFQKWGNMKPAIFEISIQGEDIELIDIATNTLYQQKANEDFDYIHGDIAVGILVPYVNTHEFFSTMVQIPGEQKEQVADLIDDLAMNDQEIDDVFPEFIADVLSMDASEELEWYDIQHKFVATLFTNHALKNNCDQMLIQVTVKFWNEYCMMTDPYIRKPQAYAASLDYFVQQTFLEYSDVTQAQLAKEYGTSAGTISSNYRKLADAFEELMFLKEQESKEDTLPPNHMEREMRNIQKLLEEQEFDSEEELNAFMDNMIQNGDIPSAPMEPRDIAQDLIDEAQSKQGAAQKRLIKEALEVYPNSPDAYVLLAQLESSADKRLDLFAEGIVAGEKDLGEAFFAENKGHFWVMIETRPYMRVKAAYANTLELSGLVEEARDTYSEMLELNPNDNQGMRYFLLRLYIECEQFDEANDLINTYNEKSAVFTFSKALVHYETNGLTKEGINLVKEAHQCNPYVIDYLLGRKRIPHEQSEYIGRGDESEAIAYVQENAHLWVEAEEVLQAFNAQK